MPAKKAPAAAKGFDLLALNDKHPLVSKLQDGLAKGAGQSVPFVVVGKVKRVAGDSAKAVDMTLENGQKVTFLVRGSGDVFRVLVNDKDFPLRAAITLSNTVPGMALAVGKKPAGAEKNSAKNANFVAMSKTGFDDAMEEIGAKIRAGQKAFDKKANAEKVVIPKTADTRKAPVSPAAQLKQLAETEKTLDEQIATKTEERDHLQQRLDELQGRPA